MIAAVMRQGLEDKCMVIYWLRFISIAKHLLPEHYCLNVARVCDGAVACHSITDVMMPAAQPASATLACRLCLCWSLEQRQSFPLALSVSHNCQAKLSGVTLVSLAHDVTLHKF